MEPTSETFDQRFATFLWKVQDIFNNPLESERVKEFAYCNPYVVKDYLETYVRFLELRVIGRISVLRQKHVGAEYFKSALESDSDHTTEARHMVAQWDSLLKDFGGPDDVAELARAFSSR